MRTCSSTLSSWPTRRGKCRGFQRRSASFFQDTLLAHARAEEEILYPEWASLVGFADAADPMVHDHEAIVARIERLEGADIGDVDTLQELLYGLHALISVHFRKERIFSCPPWMPPQTGPSESSRRWRRRPATDTPQLVRVDLVRHIQKSRAPGSGDNSSGRFCEASAGCQRKPRIQPALPNPVSTPKTGVLAAENPQQPALHRNRAARS